MLSQFVDIINSFVRNSKIFQPIKSLGRKGSLKKPISNSGEQIQDEFDENKVMCNMKDERIRLIQALQDLAFAKSIRITILGYVHLALH